MTVQKPEDCPKCQMPRKGAQDGPCGAPLLSAREMDSGICNSCAEGWASPESYPATWEEPPKTELVPDGHDAPWIARIVRASFEMGKSGAPYSKMANDLHPAYKWAYRCGRMVKNEGQRAGPDDEDPPGG